MSTPSSPTPTPGPSMTPAQEVLLWSQVIASLSVTSLNLSGKVQPASLIPIFEQMVAAAVSALEAAKGEPVTPDTVEKLKSTIVLLPPTD